MCIHLTVTVLLVNRKERFEEKFEPIPECGCWVWTAAHHERGYGYFHFPEFDGRKSSFAHRVSYFLYKGVHPKDMSVCHTCDNPSCVNPDHLFLGSHADNMKDMSKKGRATGRRKYSYEELYDVRHNLTCKEANLKYGMDLSYAWRVKYKSEG